MSITLLLLLLASTDAVAQGTGAEDAQLPKPNNKGRNMFSGKVYVRAGLNQPLGRYKQTINDGVFFEDGMSGRSGWSFSVGSYFYVTPKPIAGAIKIGINWSYANFTMGICRFSDRDDQLATYTDMGIYGFSMKAGPVVTWSQYKNFAIDAFAKVSPTLVISDIVLKTDLATGTVDDIFGSEGSYGIKTNLGLCIRYHIAVLTAAFDLGSIKREDALTEGISMPQSEFQLMLGFQL